MGPKMSIVAISHRALLSEWFQWPHPLINWVVPTIMMCLCIVLQSKLTLNSGFPNMAFDGSTSCIASEWIPNIIHSLWLAVGKLKCYCGLSNLLLCGTFNLTTPFFPPLYEPAHEPDFLVTTEVGSVPISLWVTNFSLEANKILVSTCSHKPLSY